VWKTQARLEDHGNLLRTKTLLLLWLGVLILAGLPTPVAAASFSPADIIAAVNSLRAARGLAPYQVDADLMAYAQQHSDYQANIDSSTHQHSDGSTSLSLGIQENVAAGDNNVLSVNAIVNQIWSDQVHMQTMVGNGSGFIGVGVASNGSTTYVTLNVRPGGDPAPAQAVAAPQAANTPQAIVPMVTNTPLADGTIVHIVGYGQSLWEIAISYGMTIDQIRGLNGLSGDSTSIFVGQRLIIRLAVSPTPTTLMTATLTETPTPSRTPSPTSTHLPVKATQTATPTPEIERQSFNLLALMSDTHRLGLILIVVAGSGLVLLLAFGFRK
jgi:LysM repeat protein